MSCNNNLWNDLDSLIRNIIVKNTTNPEDKYSDAYIKSEFIKGLDELRSKYGQSVNFNEEIKEYLSDTDGYNAFGELRENHKYLEQLTTLDISEKKTNIDTERASKMEAFSKSMEAVRQNDLKGQFLNKYFLLNSTGKLFFLRNFKNDIVQDMFKDMSGDVGKFVNHTSSKELTKAINRHRDKLKDKIQKAIATINQPLSTVFNNYILEQALERVDSFFTDGTIIPQQLLYQIPVLDTLTDVNKRTLLEGYQAFVALKNFDPLMKLTFNKSISIKNMNNYNLNTEDKYSINFGDNVTTTWRNEDLDTDETDELSGVVQIFLESCKVYNSNGIPTNRNLVFNDIKIAIGKAMQQFNDQYNEVSTKTFTDTESRDILHSLIQEYGDIYGNNQISYLFEKYIDGKNFKQILASAKEHPAELMPIAFRLMAKDIIDSQNMGINPIYNKFPKKGTKIQETIQSIYYNVYAPTNSLLSMSVNTDPNINTMYDYVNGIVLNIENKPMIEYENDFYDGITIKSLATKNANSRLNSLTRAMDGKYNRKNILGIQIDNNHTQYNTFDIIDNLDSGSIQINIGDYTIKVTKPAPKFQNITLFQKDKKVTNLAGIMENFLPFISEVLEVPLIKTNSVTDITNTEIYDNYKNLNGKDLDLINLAATVLYNYQVGKHLQNTTESSYRSDVEPYYDQIPEKMYQQFQPQLIPKSQYNTIKTVSYAKDMADGYAEVNTVKDGSGKQISTLALSSLASKVGEIWENHTKNTNSPSHQFSIYNMFEGVEFMRDFSSSGENKQAKSFTQAELAIASIIYDMYGDMEVVEKDDDTNKFSNKNDGYLRVMGPIIADKSNLAKLKFRWDSRVSSPIYKYDENGNIVEEVQKTLRDLTVDDLKYLIKKEFGEYYEQMYSNIENQYQILNIINPTTKKSYIQQAAENINPLYKDVPPVRFDYGSNFKDVNNIFGDHTAEVLHEAIYLAQQDGYNPEIIDQVGYIENKGRISNNPSIIHQMKLYGNRTLLESDINTNETYEDFWIRKESQIVTDFLQSGTVLKVKDGQVPRKGDAIAVAIKHNQNFLHNGNIGIVKITEGDYSYIITKLSDFEEWFPYSKFRNSQGDKLLPINDIKSPSFNINDTLEKMSNGDTLYKCTINPELLRHNLLDLFLSEEFVMSTTGTYVAHPAKDTEIHKRESTQFGQAVKRYVSYTASKHREMAGNLNGITNDINIAIIEDYRDSGLNYSGDYSKSSIKPFDGASFYSIAMRYLDNNSLGADAMGIDKKPFAHHMGENSGIGFILKTAGFALTNDRIRNSISTDSKGNVVRFYENLNKQMQDIPWNRYVGDYTYETWDGNWTKDFNGQTIDYGDWYVYNPTDNKWYVRNNPALNENGETIVQQQEVTVTGEPINNQNTRLINLGIVNSNWKLWNVFGGMYSGHKENGNLTYIEDNTSVEQLVKAMNLVGQRKSNTKNVLGQEGVNQILKKAQVHIAATGGAVKYGAANINSNRAYFDPNYHLTYMAINSYDLGEQLDAEHHAEHGSVSLMTQVVNALGARGYSRALAQECYEALEVIAETTNSEGLQGLQQLNDSGNPELLQNAIAQIIYKTLTRVSDSDGNILNALAATLLETGSTTFDWSNISGKFPISHPAIFQKIVSSISSELEKGIRLKFKGNMFVLNPSNKIYTTINGKLAGYYKNHQKELENIENYNKLHPIQPYQVKVGFNYRSISTGELIQVDNPSDIESMKIRMLGGEKFYETVQQNGEPLGHDLAPYNAIFADTNGNYYNIWDLESAWNLWKATDSKQKTILRRQLQKDLNAIAEGIESKVNIRKYAPSTGEFIYEKIFVDKSKTQVDPYEIILPRMYKTEFGLNMSDELDTIKNDQLFFVKRAIENWKSKIDYIATDEYGDPDKSLPPLYNLELKSLDGNHIYLGFPPTEVSENLTRVNLETEIDNDVLYRITPEGRRLYTIPYHLNQNKKIVPEVEIYKTYDGNEIIYSHNLTHFLNEFSYNSVIITNSGQNTEILRQLNNSDNTTAKRKVDLINRVISKQFNKQTNVLNQTGELKNNEDFSDLFDSDVSLTLDDIFQFEEFKDYIDIGLKFISNDVEYQEAARVKLKELINSSHFVDIEELKNNNPLFRGMIQSGIETHTSFLTSLDQIVSRTPAQSQQSFMAMRVAAFAMEETNSAYVSRMQFLLQGSK